MEQSVSQIKVGMAASAVALLTQATPGTLHQRNNKTTSIQAADPDGNRFSVYIPNHYNSADFNARGKVGSSAALTQTLDCRFS